MSRGGTPGLIEPGSSALQPGSSGKDGTRGGAIPDGVPSTVRTDQLIERFKETYRGDSSAPDKLEKSGNLVRLLSARVGIEEAIRVVEEVVGRGRDRAYLIRQAFSGSLEDLDFLMSEAGRQKGDLNRGNAYLGVFQQTLETRGTKEFIKLMHGDLPPEISNVLWVSIGDAIGPNHDKSIGLARFEELKNISGEMPESVRKKYMLSLLKAGSLRFPFESWEGLMKVRNDFSSDASQSDWNSLAAQIGKDMARVNPEGALSLIEKNASSISSVVGSVLNEAMSSYASSNYDAAVEWFDARRGELAPEVADGMKGVFLSSVIARGEVEDAQAWFNQISNEKLRVDASLELGKLTAGQDLKQALRFSESLKGRERDEYVTGVMSAAKPDQVGDVVQLISNESTLESTMSSAKYRNQVATAAKQYAELSIENAREWVSTLPESKQIPAVRGMTSVWAKKAPDELAAWLNTLPNGEVRNMGVQSLVDAIKKDDPASAEQWIQSMKGQR